MSSHPVAFISSLTLRDLWAPRLSMITTCPGAGRRPGSTPRILRRSPEWSLLLWACNSHPFGVKARKQRAVTAIPYSGAKVVLVPSSSELCGAIVHLRLGAGSLLRGEGKDRGRDQEGYPGRRQRKELGE